MIDEYIVICQKDLNGVYKRYLQEAMNETPYMNQSEAIRLLKPYKIGRRMLETAMEKGEIANHKIDFDDQFSPVYVSRKDVQRFLNKILEERKMR